MPKATSPAAETATPETLPDLALGVPAEPTAPAADEPEPQPAPGTEPDPPLPQAEPVDEDAPEWGRWRYTGESARVYAGVPVTAEPGDVIAHYGPPAPDGMWERTDEPATRHPDNHRPDPDPEPDVAPAGGAAPTVKEG